MTKPIGTGSDQAVQIQGLQTEAGIVRREPDLSNGDRGTSGKHTKEPASEKRQSSGHKKDSGGDISQRMALFEQQLLVAGKPRPSSNDSETGDGDAKEDRAVLQVLFDSTRPAASGGPAAPPTVSTHSRVDARVERIFRQVTMQVEAAIRPGPCVTPAPVTITIPLDATATGLSNIEVTLGDTMVAVKLNFAPILLPGDASQQLIGAAGQLGHMLQAHLPGRGIRIMQSFSAADDAPDDQDRNQALAGAASPAARIEHEDRQ